MQTSETDGLMRALNARGYPTGIGDKRDDRGRDKNSARTTIDATPLEINSKLRDRGNGVQGGGGRFNFNFSFVISFYSIVSRYKQAVCMS